MKVGRHAKIVELIGKYHIETQEELAEHLNLAVLILQMQRVCSVY